MDLKNSQSCTEWVQRQIGVQLTWAILVTAVATIVVLYVAVVYQRRKKLPPGPWPWPIVGNLPVVFGSQKHKLAHKYGGLMYLQLSQKPCLVVWTAAAAKEIFRKHDATFASRPSMLIFYILTGGRYRNLGFAPYGPFWRRFRRIANTQLFSPAVHASHEPIREREIHSMLRVLLEDSYKGKPINIKSWLTSVTANNMTMMLTNKRIFEIATMFLGKNFQVDEHRKRAKEMDPNDTEMPDDIDVLLNTSLDDGDWLADRDIASLVVVRASLSHLMSQKSIELLNQNQEVALDILQGLMNAGTDTSANTVEWGMAELMANPEIRKQAQAELDAVVQDRLVKESDIPNLPFLQAIVKETYRMHPSVPLSQRHESHQPCVISGWEFPALTELILNLYAIHRDPSVYENPDKFDPSRFTRNPKVDPLAGNDFYELIPFGAGRRMCAGHHLGNVTVTSMLANLLQCFE
ncbi:flavonoid 3'-monooxygenase [Physcomitrium patens]|uniref:flavonoid 3'-monooxygenase n=1 Tax=Physcomitrium patens TaxID=3218 RepID=UPI003CCE3A55